MRAWAAAVALGVVACGGSKVRQVSGSLSAVPATLDFGDVALGEEQTAQVLVQNDGIVPLTVDARPFADPAFEVTGLPVTLVAGSHAKLAVRYRPQTLGAQARTLDLITEDPATQVALRGHAVLGLATLSQDGFDFGNVVVNETSTQMLSLSNTTDGHALTSVRLELQLGGDASAFNVRPPGESPLPANQSMSATIDFHPARTGNFTAVVAVTPCPTCSPRNVSLTGRGVTSLLDVEPPNIDFGPVALGASAAQTFTVTNTSHAPLTVLSLDLKVPDMEAALDGGALPLTLAPGQTMGGTARFHAHSLGDTSGQASFPVSDGGPGTLGLFGTGFGPVLQVTPRSVFVGATALGTSRPGTLTLTNVGLDPQKIARLRVNNISVVSTDPAWSLDTSTPIDVGEPGSSAAVKIRFTPKQEGLSRMTLVIDSNDAMNPRIEVPVAALGRRLPPCALSVAPAPPPVDFGPTPVQSSTVQGFELTNVTSPADDCIVGDPVLSGSPAFRWPGGVAPVGRTLPPGGRMSVRIEFAPDAAMSYRASVSFYVSNPAAQQMTVDLAGTGAAGCFYLSPPTADFGGNTLGCGIPSRNVYAVNHCARWVHVSAVSTAAPFSVSTRAPFDVAPQTSTPISVGYAPPSVGDDVGMLYVSTSENPRPLQAGLTGGVQSSAMVLDQWDQSSPKVDLLVVVDNSGSMANLQRVLQSSLDRLWNRIALANADFHIAVTSSGMEPYTAGWSQCPGGASGGEAGRFFPVDASRPRILTPQTPDVKSVLFANIMVGICHWDERFLEPAVSAVTSPLIDSSKAPGTTFPADGNAGFLRDDARLAILVVTDTDDDAKQASPPPVDGYVNQLIGVKHGAKDLISFAALVPKSNCPIAELFPTPRMVRAAQLLNGQLFDACDVNHYGDMLESAAGSLLLPLTSFPLSAVPQDPSAIVVTVNGATVTNFSYDAGSNRIVFPPSAVPPPGSHITAKYKPACP